MSITKNVMCYSFVGQQPFKYKIFIEVFQYILKSLETFLIRNYLYSNAKNTNKTKNPGQTLI